MILRKWWLRFSGTAARDELRKIDRRVRSTEVEDAVRQVEAALMQRDKFRVVANTAGSLLLDCRIPPLAARLFRRYAMINTIYSDVTISHELSRPSNLLPGYVTIGDYGGHAEILVGQDDERVYVFDGGDGDPFEDSYPSIYHFLLSIIAIVQPELVSLAEPD